jgi:Na+/proline symporter
MSEGMIALFIPIVGVVSIAVVILVFLFLRYRTRLDYQQTVRHVVEKGQQLTPEFLERLGEQAISKERNPNRDLRFGAIAIAIGIAIGSFGLILGEPDAVRPLMGVGNLPFLVGVAMIVLWKFAPRV